MTSTSVASALASLPDELRSALIDEYRKILQNFLEHRWQPSELSAGLFCEIVFTILFHYPNGNYPTRAKKPGNFVEACKKLENVPNVPRSFQILIPRLLPALYEIRNNRGVGHVGGDVDSNQMDATAAVAICKWTMAELIRVFHALSIEEAQALSDAIAERTVPLVWVGSDTKRVLLTGLRAGEQILILLAASPSGATSTQLQQWSEYKNSTRLREILRRLHSQRLVECPSGSGHVALLPPGVLAAEKLIANHSNVTK